MAIKLLSVCCFLLSVVLVRYTAFSFDCVVNNFQNYKDHISGCSDVKVLKFNVTTPWPKIPQDLINRTEFIHSIILSDENLTSIDNKEFCRWPHLTTLNAERNAVQSLPARMLVECRLLTFLSVASNKISEIYDDAFHGLTLLHELDLSDNQITSLSEDTFKPLTSLKILRLNNNDIQVINSDILNNNHKLELLELSYNQLKVMEHGAFWHLDNLVTLDVSYNPELKEIDLSEMDRLNNVILKGDLFRFVHVPKCITQLNAESNAISSISFDQNALLDDLNLRNNSFRDFKKLADAIHLTRLDLSNNNISDIDFSYLMSTQIQHISVLENPLKKFNVKSLTSIPSLRLIEITLDNLDAQTRYELIQESDTAKIRVSDPNQGGYQPPLIFPSAVTPVRTSASDVFPVTPTPLSEITTPILNANTTAFANVTKDTLLINLDERLRKLEDFQNKEKKFNNDMENNISNNHGTLMTLIFIFLAIFTIHCGLFLYDNGRTWKDRIYNGTQTLRNRFSNNPRVVLVQDNSMENIHVNETNFNGLI